MLLDRPADVPAPPAAGVRAFLIADVRGYTRYTRERGDDAAARLAARFADLIREGLAGTDGELVDLRGDEAALAFGSVRQALRTALVLQDRFARERAADPTLPLGVGMGLDAGEAVAVAGGYRGMALNLAARLCAAASAGEVLVSEAVAHLAGPVEGLACLDRRPLTLKGLDAPVRALQALPTPFVAIVAAPTPHEGRVGIERLLVDLRGAGVACWDTTAMEEAEGAAGLRAGVRACRAVLCVSAPGTGQARPVTAAREVAGVYRRPVVTILLEGAEGTDADNSADAPLAEREGTLDLRGTRYATALPFLVGLLEQVEECVIAPAEFAEATALGGPIAMDPATQVASRNPYKGLRAFREDDAGDFFGRAALVADLVAAVRAYIQPGAARFLSVVGPSGSGKSSVVLAGLLPQLRRGAVPGSDHWVYLAPLVPGLHPLEALAVALNNALPGSSLGALHADLTATARGLHLLASRLSTTPDGRVVLVVDQAEELFTLTAGEDERRQVIDLLVAAASEPRGPLLVVLTLRADFYDRPLAYPALGRLMATQSTAVLPLGPAELHAAIEGPARLPDVGLRFQDDLVGDLLYEVRDQAGALPLLQFTLDQLYERREGRLLTEAAYRDLGGVRGALGRQAEATYLSLPNDEDRGLARGLFLRLIEPGASAQATTRRRAPFDELELADPTKTARLRAVAEAFIAARLLTTQESAGARTIEVSHEALIREWGRLGDWLREAREDVRLQGRISADAAAWEQRGRPADSLYRGTVLAEAVGWAERNTPSAREQAFLDTGVAEGEQQQAAERARQVRELAVARQAAAANRRAATRLRALVGVLAIFLLAAAGLTTLALGNATHAQVAERQAVSAQRQAAIARNVAVARQLAAQSGNHLDNQLDLALLLSLEANRTLDTAETRGGLLQAVSSERPFTFLQGHIDTVTGIAFSPNSRTLVSAGDDGTIRVWDAIRGRSLGQPIVVHHAVSSLSLSADGHVLAVGSATGTVQLWDFRQRHWLGPPLSVGSVTVRTLAFSPDSKLLATGDDDSNVVVRDVLHHRPFGSTLRHQWGVVSAVSFSPNGKTLVSAGDDHTIRLWDVATGFPEAVLTGHSDFINALAISPDGTLLASASNDGTFRLWDLRHGRALGTPLTTFAGSETSVSFSPDGRTLAVGAGNGTVQLWDVARRQPIGPAMQSGTAVLHMTFSPDGSTLASSSGSAILLWRLARLQPLATSLVGHTDVAYTLAFSPDGHTLFSGSWDQTIRRWDGVRGRSVGLPLRGPTSGINSVAVSPNGRLLAAACSDGSVWIWDLGHGQDLGSVQASMAPGIQAMVFSPDGKLLATGSDDHTVQMWTVTRSGGLHALGPPLEGHTQGIDGLAFSPDGRLLASGSPDGTVRLWSVARHRPLGPPLVVGANGVSRIAFSPDGKTLVSGGYWDGAVRFWDVARRTLVGLPTQTHTDGLSALTFSPDGKLLATAGEQLIQVWDVSSRQPLGAPLVGHTRWVQAVAFSPNGRILASASADATVKLWDMSLAGWKRLACRIANRNLTRQEWRQYLGDEPYHRTCPGLPEGA